MISKYKKLFMPEFLFTWTTFITTLVWALALHFADVLNNSIGNYVARFLTIIFLHLLLFGTLYLLKKAIFDNLRPSKVPVALLIATLFLGAGRGLFLQYLLVTFDSASDSSYSLRIWTSLLNTSSSLVIATLTVASLQSLAAGRNRLLIERNRLEFVQKSTEKTLTTLNSGVITKIKNDLLNQISALSKQDTESILSSLRRTIDEIVRPLSRSLDENTETWAPPTFESTESKLNWSAAFKESLRPTQINYSLVPTLMCLVAIPITLERSPIYVAIIGLPLIACVGFLWGYLVHRYIAPKFFSALAYFTLAIINGAIMGALTLIFTSDYKQPYGLFLLSIIFFPASSFVISFLTTAGRLGKEANEQLEEVTQDLAWSVARVREQNFELRKSLAATLHGEIQAKLASTYIQIENLVKSGFDTSDNIERLISGLVDTVEKMDTPTQTHNDLVGMLDRVKSNWLEVADIDVEIPTSILSEIEKDKVCAATLAEIVPELCFNSIKHGNASKIKVRLKFKTPKIVYLEVANNGSNQDLSSTIGLGSKFLNEASIKWERVQENGLTITRADFAYSQN